MTPLNLAEDTIERLFECCARDVSIPEDIADYAKDVSVQIAMNADVASLEEELVESIRDILEESGMQEAESFLKKLSTLCKTAVQLNGNIDSLVAGGGAVLGGDGRTENNTNTSIAAGGDSGATADGGSDEGGASATTIEAGAASTTGGAKDKASAEAPPGDGFADQSLAKLMAGATPSTSSTSPRANGHQPLQQKNQNDTVDLSDFVCRVPDLMLLYGGGKLLLKSALLELRKGHRYGIVGKNGAGKTTLLTMIASGKIADLPLGKFKIVTVQASVATSKASVYEYAVAALKKTGREEIDMGGMEIVRNALEMVGFGDPAMSEMPTTSEIEEDSRMRTSWDAGVSELSGGWRMRLSLAVGKIECAAPDLLLLDEPTNHLDVNAVRWLSSYLTATLARNSRTAVLIVSHDAEFLDKVCTDVIHFENQQLTYYNGGFASFRQALGVSEREASDLLQTMAHAGGSSTPRNEDQNKDDQDEKLQNELFGGSSSSFAAAKKAALDAERSQVEDSLAFLNLDDTLGTKGNPEKTKEEDAKAWVSCAPVGGPDKLSFPIPGKLDGIANDKKSILELKNINFRYNEGAPLVLEDISCRLTLASRVALEGANGAGKSTLLGLLSGELSPDLELKSATGAEPVMYKHRNLRLAYIAQHHTFHLQEFAVCAPLVYMQKRFKNGYDEELQKRLLTLTPEEQAHVDEMARKLGKYGKRVRDIAGRQKRGKEFYYEIMWEELPDSKQNTFEPLSKLREMGVENICRAYDERQQAVAAGNDQRPLSNREILKHFENFGFDEDMVERRQLGSFSMGQKSRLLLAASMWIKPHCLFLDEPTNYIDQETLDALERALKFFRGAVLIVSHNHAFLTRVCSEHWRVEDKRVVLPGKATR
ncbi:unnamed protein product [Amoebophrya sp. A25]|nr:unnamed protein product [Amoebophrya sp. A25]|eukprot:GSA25T00004294001.1